MARGYCICFDADVINEATSLQVFTPRPEDAWAAPRHVVNETSNAVSDTTRQNDGRAEIANSRAEERFATPGKISK